MQSYPPPYLLTFEQLGTPDIGYISVTENSLPSLPFAVQRVFWTYYTPDNIIRGRHAHYATEHIIIAVVGCILVTIERADGTLEVFRLQEPNTVQLALASQPFSEADYIRDHREFKSVWQ
jgi:hypothetical protein